MMVEGVARAIDPKAWAVKDTFRDSLGYAGRRHTSVDRARAAIKAMRLHMETPRTAGFLASLTAEQQERALAYRGNDQFPHVRQTAKEAALERLRGHKSVCASLSDDDVRALAESDWPEIQGQRD